jgi:hypothetical protein
MLLAASCSKPAPPAPPPPPVAPPPAEALQGPPRPFLDDLGPRTISNQTSYPVWVYGRGFAPGMKVRLGLPYDLTLDAAVVDPERLTVRVPARPLAAASERVTVEVTLLDAKGALQDGAAKLVVVNDAAYPAPTTCALSPDGSALYVASETTDEVARYDTRTGARTSRTLPDGPRSLFSSPLGLVVVDEWSQDLRVLGWDLREDRTLPLPERPQEVLADGKTAWVTTRQDHLLEVELATGAVKTHPLPGRHPRALARGAGGTFVAEIGTDDVVFVPDDGKPSTRIAPGPGTPITGGPTEKFGAYVMGGKAPRALVFDPDRQVVYQSSIGPNIGPNPARQEVSMNSGVGLIDARTLKFTRHVGRGLGLIEGLALDRTRKRLWGADVGVGTIVGFDLDKLAKDPAHAQQVELPLLPDKDSPRVRPDSELGAALGRAGPELHTGPKALCLDEKQARLYAVNRLAGTVSVIDVKNPAKPTVAATWAAPEGTWTQKDRRLGDILYSTDVGHSAMTCDACHYEGHTSGVLYEKTHPLRIYRASTLRNIVDSAPYFTPSALKTLAIVAHDVLTRNRFQNPEASPSEIDLLASYQQDFPVPPNPNVGAADGAPPASLVLPDGRTGHPKQGMDLFFGKAVGCATAVCHPAPLFSSDQTPRTRGRFLEVGTPVILPLRPQFQEQVWNGWPVPPLVGAWDVFPMLQSGSGGLWVEEGGSVVPDQPFALRAVLEMKSGDKHGHVSALTPEQRDDLLAYLLTL